MNQEARIGILLVNLGTPDSADVGDVRRYLREFLSDPRVIDIHPVARWLLLNLVILPFRPQKSAAAYKKVWTAEGSPLLVYSQQLRDALASEFQGTAEVELAMRYGQPSISGALKNFETKGIHRIIVFPLFPQYASASSGSALQQTLAELGDFTSVPDVQIVGEFYSDPGYIHAVAELARQSVAAADHVLISFHGLPERHIRNGDVSGSHCLVGSDCCDAIVSANARCYRAQSFATARLLAEELGLDGSSWSIGFQSRLGRDPWIQPFTDVRLDELARAGVTNVAVLEPSFVADCLETLEEIGIRGQEDFVASGGEKLHLAPCLNASPQAVKALAGIIRRGSSWL